MPASPVSRTAGSAAFTLFNGALESSAWLIMLPSVARDFDASKTAIAWVIVAFALGMAGSGLAAGRLCDLIGLKRVGFISLVSECLILGAIVAAPELWMIYPLRFLQGIARAGGTNAAAALFIGSYPPASRGRVLGWRYSIVNGGQIAGVLFAGLTIDALGWRFALAGLTGLAALQAMSVVLFAREDPPRQEQVRTVLRRFDWWGALAFLVAISIIIFSAQLFRGGTVQWGIACLTAAAGVMWLAVRIEKKAVVPALDLSLFTNVPFSAATTSLMVMALCTGSATFLFPFYMQDGLGWSPSVTATAFLALGAIQLIASPFTGGIADRIGTGVPIVVGATIVGTSLVLGSVLGSGAQVWQVAGVMLLMGFGMVVFQTPNNSVIFQHAGSALGAASAITGVYRFVGISLGGAMGASFLTVFGGESVIDGFSSGMRILAGIAFVGLVAMQILQKVGEQKAPSEVTATSV